MALVQGRPFLEHILDYWIEQGLSEFVLSVGFMAEAISEHFGNEYHGARILYSEESSPLGTGGGLAAALSKFPTESPFLVLNGDTFFKVSLGELTDSVRESSAAWTLALFHTSDSARYGALTLGPRDRILSIGTHQRAEPFWANGGVWAANPGVAGLRFPESSGPYSLEAYLEGFIASSRFNVFGLRSEGTFIDIGLPGDYMRAQAMEEFGSSL